MTAYAAPTTASAASTLPPTWASQFLTMPVIATVTGWDEAREVARPTEPTTAWIPAAAAVITRTPYHIVVDLGTSRLLLFDQSRLLMCVPASVGAAASPTPTGHYFVGLLVQPPPTDGGTFLVITSAVISGVTDWEQAGNAMITIAGSAVTAGPRTTTGSVQLPGADQGRLRPVPLGSPVDLVAALNRPLNQRDERLCASRTGIPATHHGTRRRSRDRSEAILNNGRTTDP
ncbi:MAG: L,D-transpeptidase [Acidimicrobiales bacterium]